MTRAHALVAHPPESEVLVKCTAKRPRCGSFGCYANICENRGDNDIMRKKYASEPLKPDCEDTLKKMGKLPEDNELLSGLLTLIAQVLDAGAAGEDVNLRIGVTKKKDAFTVTLFQEGEAMYATGTTLPGLLASVQSLL